MNTLEKINNLTEDEINYNKLQIIRLLSSVRRDGIDKMIQYLESTNFFYDPASANYHGAFRGGLAQHSLCVYNILMDFKNKELLNASREEIVICSLLHDVCKINTYSLALKNVKENGVWIQVPAYKNENPEFPYGHGEKSVDIIRDYINLTVNEKLAIRWHMGAYVGKDQWGELGQAQDLSMLAYWLNVADMFASRYLC